MYGTSVIINGRGVKIAHRVYETVTVERTPNLAAQWGAEDAQQGISKRGVDYFADPDILNVYVSAYNATVADGQKDQENFWLWKWTEIYFRQKALGASSDAAIAQADCEIVQAGRVWSGYQPNDMELAQQDYDSHGLRYVAPMARWSDDSEVGE